MKTGKVLSKKGMKNKIWLVLRQAAILRDGGKCQICYKKADLQVDHCFTRAIGRLHFDLSNLTTLCAKCHTSKSLRKGGPVDKQVKSCAGAKEMIGGLGHWESLGKHVPSVAVFGFWKKNLSTQPKNWNFTRKGGRHD